MSVLTEYIVGILVLFQIVRKAASAKYIGILIGLTVQNGCWLLFLNSNLACLETNHSDTWKVGPCHNFQDYSG